MAINVTKANAYPQDGGKKQFSNITIFIRTDVPGAEEKLRQKILSILAQMKTLNKIDDKEVLRLRSEVNHDGGPFMVCQHMFNLVTSWGKPNKRQFN